MVRDIAWILTASGFGMIMSFLFWVVVSQTTSPSVIGMAGSYLALSMFLSSAGTLGMGTGIVRFLHKFESVSRGSNHFVVIGTMVAVLISFVIGIFTVSDASASTSKISMVLVFTLITGLGTANLLLDSVLLSVGWSRFIAVRSAISGGIRIGLVFGRPIDVMWIMMVWLLGSFVSMILGELLVFSIKSKGSPILEAHGERELRKEVLTYSLKGAIGALFWNIPNGIFPLVASQLGAEQAGYYFVAFTVGSPLVAVIQTITLSYFNYASKIGRMPVGFTKRLIAVELVVTIGFFLIILSIGQYVLSFFGSGYSVESLSPLLVLASSYPFLGMISVYVTVFAVNKQTERISYVYVPSSIIILLVGIYAMGMFGVVGIMIGYLVGYAMGVLISLYLHRMAGATGHRSSRN